MKSMLKRLMLLLFGAALVLAGLQSAVGQPPAPDYFAEAVVDPLDPFVGQQVRYQFRFYAVAPVVDAIYEPSDFEGFWRAPGNPRAEQTVISRDGRQYRVTTVETVLFPTRTGEQVIAPARVLLPETVFRPEQVIEAPPVILQVRPLPDDAPDHFTGAVGQFSLEARLSQATGAVGEPLLLQLTVSGTGNVEALLPPHLVAIDGWRTQVRSSRYRTAEAIPGEPVVGIKDYEFLLIPERSGALTAPLIEFVYYDPQVQAYRSLTTTPVVVVVAESEGNAAVLDGGSGAGVDDIRLKPMLAQTHELTRMFTTFWPVWLMPLLGLGAATAVALRQQQGRQRRAQRRQTQAYNRACARLKAAVDAPDVYAVVERTLQQYFEDKSGRSEGSINRNEMIRILDASGLKSETLAGLKACLEAAIEGQYAPHMAKEPSSLAAQAMRVLHALEQEWPPV